MRDRPDKPAEELPQNPWPLGVAAVVALGGLAVVAIGEWRSGAVLVGSAVALAALLRLVLPERMAGLLVIRRRWIDVVGLAGLAAAIIVLAFVVPPGT